MSTNSSFLSNIFMAAYSETQSLSKTVFKPTVWKRNIDQARNQDFMWGGANEAKVDQTTEMYFLLSDPFI